MVVQCVLLPWLGPNNRYYPHHSLASLHGCSKGHQRAPRKTQPLDMRTTGREKSSALPLLKWQDCMDRARADLYYSCSSRSILPLIDWGSTHRNMHIGRGAERKKYFKKKVTDVGWIIWVWHWEWLTKKYCCRWYQMTSTFMIVG